MINFYRTTFLCFSVLMLAALAAMAQPPEDFSRGFGISPASLSVEVRPGARTIATFTLSNVGSRGSGKYTIEVSDLGQSESGSVSPVPRGQGARSCANWIDVPAVVEIPAGSSRKIDVPIRCPPGARGAYYAILKVALAPSSPPDKGMVIKVQPTIGVSLEAIIPRPAPSHLEPTDLIYQRGSGAASSSLLLKVENTGVWKKPIEGDILVYARSGQFPVRTSIPYKNTGNPYEVYPGMTLSVRCPLPRPLEPGTHSVSVRLRLTQKAQARKEFELKVPGRRSGTATIAAQAGEKVELDINLSVDPMLIEEAIPPGGMRTLPIRVRNEDTREVHVRAQVTQARMEPSGMFTYTETAQYETLDWLSVTPETFDLGPRRSTTVRVQAAIPKTGSLPMPLVAVVRLQAFAAPTEYHGDWSSGGEFPVIVVVQDPKAPEANLEIVRFEVVRPSREQNPSAAVLRVKNTGSKVARAYGMILLERSSGQEIARMEIGSSQPELITSGSEREFRMPLGPLDAGKFRVRAELSVLGDKGSTKRAEVTFQSTATVPAGLR